MTDFELTRSLFELPPGITYLDGNSLGPLPRAAIAKVSHVMAEEWGKELIRAWNTAGWFTQPRHVGDRIAKLIGAEPGSVMMGDTLSIKVYQALAAALDLNPARRVVLSDAGNFPTDLYVAEGLIKSLGRGHELRLVAPEDVERNITDEVAALLLTEVDYRTGQRYDMTRLSRVARECGVLTIWDLAHSAGAFPVGVAAAGADFAAGCTYKYLNGGPGAPAFVYVAPRHAESARAALSGWMGHRRPFAFVPDYEPAGGVERMRVGTPPVLALAVLEAALDIWDQVDLTDVRKQSIALGDIFISEVERTCPALRLVTPRDAARRGSQVSFAFASGYAAMQALIARGVVGDFRSPDIMRFGICPLYNTEEDMREAARHLAEIMATEEWKRPEFSQMKAVT